MTQTHAPYTPTELEAQLDQLAHERTALAARENALTERERSRAVEDPATAKARLAQQAQAAREARLARRSRTEQRLRELTPPYREAVEALDAVLTQAADLLPQLTALYADLEAAAPHHADTGLLPAGGLPPAASAWTSLPSTLAWWRTEMTKAGLL